MKHRENAVFEAAVRAQSFLADLVAILAEEYQTDLARLRQRLDEVVARLGGCGVEQDAGHRGMLGETARQRELRLDLVKEWLKPIAVIARRKLRHLPEFSALELPKSVVGPAFIASARAMVAAAASHRETLVAYGMPENYEEEIGKAIDELVASHSNREHNRGRRVGATKGLEEETKEARTVLAVLDARMRRWLRGNEPLQRGWEGARRIRRRPGPVSGAAPAATTTASESTSVSDPPLKMVRGGEDNISVR